MQRQSTIQTIIQNSLNPTHLEVINESDNHNVPPGSESHFKLVVVSDEFAGKMLVARHRMLNHLLKDEFNAGLHALALHTMTPAEWQAKNQQAPVSPECLGGSKG